MQVYIIIITPSKTHNLFDKKPWLGRHNNILLYCRNDNRRESVWKNKCTFIDHYRGGLRYYRFSLGLLSHSGNVIAHDTRCLNIQIYSIFFRVKISDVPSENIASATTTIRSLLLSALVLCGLIRSRL